MTVTDESSTVANWFGWPTIHGVVNRMWDPENSPHHSIIGLTGSGKSYLAINGLLPMCLKDRVLIVDTKGDDRLVSTTGKPVASLPDQTWSVKRNNDDRANWYRLVVKTSPNDRGLARDQVRRALAKVYKEGEWVVYFDEIRDICDPRAPGLGLLPWVDEIYRKGRSRHLSVIAATQAPRYVPTSFYDQASFAWIGRIRDKQRQKRLLEIGGMTSDSLPLIAQLQRRQWLLAADNGEYFARTSVT